ncbi:hypothetical protein Gohar_003361, partial [Gossypium harknessii]|nr:hypothetical protein [Gossypium harknessii]
IGIIGINVYYLITSLVDWLVHNDVPKLGNVFIGIVVLTLTAIYIIAIGITGELPHVYMHSLADVTKTYKEIESKKDVQNVE